MCVSKKKICYIVHFPTEWCARYVYSNFISNKNEKYHTLSTVLKYDTVRTVLKYDTVRTVPKIIETEEKIDTLLSYRHFNKKWRILYSWGVAQCSISVKRYVNASIYNIICKMPILAYKCVRSVEVNNVSPNIGHNIFNICDSEVVIYV